MRRRPPVRLNQRDTRSSNLTASWMVRRQIESFDITGVDIDMIRYGDISHIGIDNRKQH